MCSCYIVQLWLVSTVEFWRFHLRAVGSAARFKQADEWTQLRWIICGEILLMIFQNVATYSYICTYVLNAQPCIVWEGKMFIEYSIHTQDLVWSSRKNRDFSQLWCFWRSRWALSKCRLGCLGRRLVGGYRRAFRWVNLFIFDPFPRRSLVPTRSAYSP